MDCMLIPLHIDAFVPTTIDLQRTASVDSLRAGKGRLHAREDAPCRCACSACLLHSCKHRKVAENEGVPLRAASGRACARRAGARLHARQVRGARAAPGVQQRTRVGKKLPAIVCADDRPLAGVCRCVVHQQLQAHLAAPASLIRLSARVGLVHSPNPNLVSLQPMACCKAAAPALHPVSF